MSAKDYSQEHVIVLHGITKSNALMSTLAKHIQKAGFTVHNISYPSMHFSIESIAKQKLQPIVEHIAPQAKKIHFVTHSMGGIVLRALVNSYPSKKIDRVVMIAPPNHGSIVAQFFQNWWPYQLIYGPAGQQLVKSGDKAIHTKLKRLEKPLGIIAGNWTFEFWFRWLFQGANDGKVSVESTKLKEMHDHLVVPFSHGNIVFSQYVAKQCLQFLKRGHFKQLKNDH